MRMRFLLLTLDGSIYGLADLEYQDTADGYFVADNFWLLAMHFGNHRIAEPNERVTNGAWKVEYVHSVMPIQKHMKVDDMIRNIELRMGTKV